MDPFHFDLDPDPFPMITDPDPDPGRILTKKSKFQNFLAFFLEKKILGISFVHQKAP